MVDPVAGAVPVEGIVLASRVLNCSREPPDHPPSLEIFFNKSSSAKLVIVPKYPLLPPK